MIPKQLITSFPELKNHHWENVGTRKANSVLNRDIYIEAFSEARLRKITGTKHGCRNLLFISSNVFIEKNEFKAFADQIVASALSDPIFYVKLTSNFKKACERLKKYSFHLKNTDAQHLDTEKLGELFDKAIKQLLELISFSYINHNEEEIPTRILDAILRKHKADHSFRTKLLVPLRRKTLLQVQRKELKKIAKEIIDLNNIPIEIINKINEHIKKYEWIDSAYFNIKELTFQDIIEQIKRLSIENDENDGNDGEKAFDEAVKHLKLDKNELTLITALREQLFYKTLRKELISLFSFAVKDIFSAIAKKQGPTYNEFINQTVEEINTFFKMGRTEKQAIEERLNGFDYVFVDGKKFILPPQKSSIEKTIAVKKVFGISGNYGTVIGRVRVIHNDSDFARLQEDEILVTSFLSPDATQYLNRINGIITDSGGLLSHAVVIARELGIPCIVGTKIATASLKTGDIVELNANKAFVQKISPKKFRKMFGITMGLCRADLYMPTHVYNTAEVIGRGHDDIIFSVKDGKCTGYFSEDVIEYMGKHGLKVMTPEFVAINQREAQKQCNDLWNFAVQCESLNFEDISTEELLKKYNSLFQKIQQTFGFFNVSQPCISFAIESEIAKQMDKLGINPESKYEIVETMLKQDQTTMIEEEEKDLIKLALKAKSGKSTEDDVLQHKRKYSFLASSENFDEFDIHYFTSRLKELNKKADHELYQNINEKTPDSEKLTLKRLEIIQKFKIPSALVHLLDAARIYSHQRMMIRIYWTKGVNVWGKLLDELAAKMNISKTEIQYLTRDEINQFFQKNIKVSKQEIEERKRLCIFAIFDREKPVLLTGKEAEKLDQIYLSEDIKEKDGVKGTVASRGIQRGKVKVLHYGKNMVQQIEEMPPDSILITGNTRPDMILALQKASAVVTDEGGICSHAALVSRELGIPCIVGTKDATSIFKDGDEVEVDANTGVVKKLSK